jgi:hypothetical protein
MKNIGVTAVMAGTLAAAILGLAGPATAATGVFPHHSHHHSRTSGPFTIYDPFTRAHAPQVDTSLHTRPLEVTTSRSPRHSDR